MGKIIKVEGYIAFRGCMKVTPTSAKYLTREIYGDWLYKPDSNRWYCKGMSYPACKCTIIEVE